MAHGDRLLQQEPHDALLAGRRGEGAVVGPVVSAGGEQAGRVEVREGRLLALGDSGTQRGERAHAHRLPQRLTVWGEWISNAIEKTELVNKYVPFRNKGQIGEAGLHGMTLPQPILFLIHSR